MESGNRLARGTRGESCRFEIRRVMGEKQKKKKDEQFPIPFRLLFEICAPFERGEDIDERFFSSCNLSGGKNRGKGGREEDCGCSGKAPVDEPRSWEHADTKFRSACYFPRYTGKCSREGFPREAINLHPNRGNHYFHRGMAHLQSKQINPLRAMNI